MLLVSSFYKGNLSFGVNGDFRFEDENDYEYEIWFQVFSRIVKK